MKKLISGFLALTIAASGSAVMASAGGSVDEWRTIDVDTSSITLRWQGQKGADGYRVYQKVKRHGKYKWASVGTVRNKTYLKITGLSEGAAYKFTVKPFAYDDWTTENDTVVGSSHTVFGDKYTPVIVSTKPGKTTVTNKTRSSAKAIRPFWTKYGFKNFVDNQSNYKYGGYNVYVYDNAEDEWEKVASVSGGRTNVRLTGAKKNTKYKVKVKVFTLSGVDGEKYAVEGDDSNVYTIKTKNYWCNC